MVSISLPKNSKFTKGNYYKVENPNELTSNFVPGRELTLEERFERMMAGL